MSTPILRQLSDEDQAIWRQYLQVTAQVAEALDRDLTAGHGLSLNEFEIMVILAQEPQNSIRMSSLAEQLVNSRSRLTHTVGRMERRGLVQRTACEHDGRGVNCALTPRGRELLAAAAPCHTESAHRNIFDKLTAEEIRQLGEILSRLA